MLTAEQVRTVKAIVAVFETGRAGGGDPAAVAILRDGAGISYGTHQATDASGTLDAIVAEYVARGGPRADELAGYLPDLAQNATAGGRMAPARLAALVELLKAVGREPEMVAAQEAVFDARYWVPVSRVAGPASPVTREGCDLRLALSWAALYDTAIQSGPGAIPTIRERFGALPPSRGGDERTWALAYLRARRTWIADWRSGDLAKQATVRRTVYRADALLAIAATGNWDLRVPVDVPLGIGRVTVT